MARKPRDYKAEYARSKARAKSLGYRSQREYKRTRANVRAANPEFTSRTKLPPKSEVSALFGEVFSSVSRLRREAEEWSNKHSHSPRSAYKPSMTDAQVRKYHRAFVEKPDTGSRRRNKKQKMKWLRDYLVPDLVDDDEWTQNYVGSDS